VSTWTPPEVPRILPLGHFHGVPIQIPSMKFGNPQGIVDEAGAEHCSVHVRQHVVSGNAAAELIRLSDEASMIVVGSKDMVALPGCS
jgi:hypothetical protein